jgi:hypothetical protein
VGGRLLRRVSLVRADTRGARAPAPRPRRRTRKTVRTTQPHHLHLPVPSLSLARPRAPRILQIRRSYFLVSLVDNNFVDGDIFTIFDKVAKGWRANAAAFERSSSGRKRGGSTGSRGSTGSGLGSGGGDDYRDGRISPTPPYRFGRSRSLSGGSLSASDWVDESM